ncbi:hypothetical protein R1flu_016422 [Riccia fluitans]|uniref:RRM domain-containing protein n=1 Tax=Riccia fluitans TaxID=41844 RepID=A0ABD1YLU0_9MARC
MFPFGGTQSGGLPVMPMILHARRHARRVYVGGFPPMSNEQTIVAYFSQVMSAVGGNTAGPGDDVVNVYINQEKKFAFVEMRTVEVASNALALDGIISGVFLCAVAGADKPDRIFLGGLPYFLTEVQIQELLECFEPLREFDLVKDPDTGNSKGCGFCLYQDPSVVDIACAMLNGLKMADKTLTICRANASGQAKLNSNKANVLAHAQQQIALQKLALQASGGSAVALGALSSLMSGLSPVMMMAAIGNGLVASNESVTRVVCLTQIGASNECMDDKEYEEIMKDTNIECGKFGNVVTLVIPRPKPDGEEVPGVGKIFVEYADTQGAIKAKQALQGRKFSGNLVIAVFYTEDKFAAGNYRG